jgi:hypothetical protein
MPRDLLTNRPSGSVFRLLSASTGPLTALWLQAECHAEMPETRCFSRVPAKRPCRCPARPMDRLQVQVLVGLTAPAGSTPVFGIVRNGLTSIGVGRFSFSAHMFFRQLSVGRAVSGQSRRGFHRLPHGHFVGLCDRRFVGEHAPRGRIMPSKRAGLDGLSVPRP